MSGILSGFQCVAILYIYQPFRSHGICGCFSSPLWLSCSADCHFKFWVVFCLPHLQPQTALMLIFLSICHQLFLFLTAPWERAFSTGSTLDRWPSASSSKATAKPCHGLVAAGAGCQLMFAPQINIPPIPLFLG